MLLTGEKLETISISTPKNLEVTVNLLEIDMALNKVSCAVEKDAGDDCDATDKALIYATATKIPEGILIDGGFGVGRVTKKGLDQPVGQAAINSTPRRMILEEVQKECENAGYKGGISIVISVPKGEEIALKTFNSRLGIVGGISILGTTGIVEPQSLQALSDSLLAEIKMLSANSDNQRLIITPGNYGEEFLKKFLGKPNIPEIKCANFIGESIEFAVEYGFKEILLVGHMGKLVKLAGGIMNTHSRYGDCRTEIFTAHAGICGADCETLKQLMDASTCDGCIEILEAVNLRNQVIQSITQSIYRQINHRIPTDVKVEVVIFSNNYGLLSTTKNTEDLIEKWGK